MPHGGSITLFSMVPILLMSYRNGVKWGLMTAFVNSLVQFVQGLNNLAYCQTLTAQIGCVLLDYLLAFTVLGLAEDPSAFFRLPDGCGRQRIRGLPAAVPVQLPVRLHRLERL